jgi:hypothetical protein
MSCGVISSAAAEGRQKVRNPALGHEIVERGAHLLVAGEDGLVLGLRPERRCEKGGDKHQGGQMAHGEFPWKITCR